MGKKGPKWFNMAKEGEKGMEMARQLRATGGNLRQSGQLEAIEGTNRQKGIIKPEKLKKPEKPDKPEKREKPASPDGSGPDPCGLAVPFRCVNTIATPQREGSFKKVVILGGRRNERTCQNITVNHFFVRKMEVLNESMAATYIKIIGRDL